MIPASYSICRGQADQGIGEAGTPIIRGEQYLAADAPLQSDSQLLHGLRHWLTLDAGPGDQGRLGGRLTGWSCFPAGPYYFVGRLGAAGTYDRRDAYFTHARAWPLADCPAGFDPGLYLGQDPAFLARAPAPGAEPAALDAAPPTCEPLAPLPAGQGLATSLIAHLFHGMVTGWPVILGVPLTEFTPDSPLARIVAFARGALPARLRRRCRVRVFSRTPHLFLAPGDDPAAPAPVDLLVIPEDLAGPALALVKRRALLLDAGGERRDGPAPAAGLRDYARAVSECAHRFPAQLTRFGDRFDRLWPATDPFPGADLTDWVTLTCNLAVALAGTAAQRGGLFANYLLAQAHTTAPVPWSTLIGPADWAEFPHDHLIRFILRADDDRGAGERRLQAALIDAFQQRGLTLDEGLGPWWNPADAAKRQRLLDLCDRAPPLISAARAHTLISALPLTDLLDTDGHLRLTPNPALALRLLGPEASERPVAGRDLLALGALLPADAGPAIAAYTRRLDALMAEDPEQTTALLIQTGAWLAWRRHAGPDLDAAARRRLALTWITSPALAALRTADARARPPQWRPDRTPDPDAPAVDPTRETWTQVLDDLAPLTPADLRLLTDPRTHWPWLHPCQADQARDLAARCQDLEAQVLLALALTRTTAPTGDAPGDDWIAPAVAALAAGAVADPALVELRRQVQDWTPGTGRDADSHPWSALLRAICALPASHRRRGGPLIAHGWDTLARLLDHDGTGYRWAGGADGRTILPLFHLAALLRPDRQAGTLAHWLMFAPDCARWRLDPDWWAALLGSVLAQTAPPGTPDAAGPREHCALAEPTRQAALALIDAARDALPAAAAAALATAWERHLGDHRWTNPPGPTAGATDR